MPSRSNSAVSEHLYVGIKGGVLAIRKLDGTIVWSTKLRHGSSFVPLLQEGDRLYAASGGEVSCLDCATGAVLWNNPLRGYGTGYASFAGLDFPIAAAALEQRARAAAAAAAAG